MKIFCKRNLEILTYDELTPEQQQYVVDNWDKMYKLSERLEHWFNDDCEISYYDEIEYLCETYSDIDINSDKIYWESNSQGPYPKWNLEDIFDEKDTDNYCLTLYGTTSTVHGEVVVYSKNPDEEDEYFDCKNYNSAINDLADSTLSEAEKTEIQEYMKQAQEFMREVVKAIHNWCTAYITDEFVKDAMENSPDRFEFTIDSDGAVREF